MLEKRYRIEGGIGAERQPGHGAPLDPRQGCGCRCATVPRTAEPTHEIERLAVELHAMRDVIATTRREVADLKQSPSGAVGMHRAASELDEVTAATERAATTILTAVEDIEQAATLLRASGLGMDRNDPVGTILERVLVLYEACNFQDIAGQRIRKVVNTLQFVEEGLDRVIELWEMAPARPMPRRPRREIGQLSGPRLPGEDGHVSQSQVDAFFG